MNAGARPPTLADRARVAMPGGVNSPVRSFRSVGGEPIFAARAEGPWLITEDGRRLLDFCLSFGPLILGHAPAEVVRAVSDAAARGASFAVTTATEIEMAEALRQAIPAAEKVRLVSSGTEACMSALRVARGATGRNLVLKFSGCYHGHADGLLVRAGSGVAGLAEATSAGVPPACAAQTVVARFNSAEQVERIVERHGGDLAAILLEPAPANVGLLLPDPAFLRRLRELADACGSLLIWDEVITAFRLRYGSAGPALGVSDVRPDLLCLGKIIGGGLPMGAVAGRAELMDLLAPLGPVYQAGTLSGNPVSVAAGLATLRALRERFSYDELNARTARFAADIEARAGAAGVPAVVPVLGSMFSVFFMDRPPRAFEDIPASHATRFRPLFHALLSAGVYLPPSPYEVAFLSAAHGDDLLERSLPAWSAAFEAAARVKVEAPP